MAKLLNPFSSEKAAGKVNGQVFYQIGPVNIIRTWVNPANTITDRRNQLHGHFSTASTAWAALSENQIKAWNYFAKFYWRKVHFGHRYQVSGFHAFVGLNTLRVEIGLSTISDPPFNTNKDYMIGVTTSPQSDYDNGILLACTTLYANSMSGYVQFLIQPSDGNPNKKPTQSHYTLSTIGYPGIDTLPSTFSLPSGYYWVRARWISNDGYPTQPRDFMIQSFPTT